MVLFLGRPVRPKITSCAVYNWENMVCTWVPNRKAHGDYTKHATSLGHELIWRITAWVPNNRWYKSDCSRMSASLPLLKWKKNVDTSLCSVCTTFANIICSWELFWMLSAVTKSYDYLFPCRTFIRPWNLLTYHIPDQHVWRRIRLCMSESASYYVI